MAQNITLMGASYSAVPKVRLPKTGGGTADFADVSDTTATASDVAQGKYFYTANGTRTQGTNTGGGGGGMNVQCYMGYASKAATSYTATDVTLTVEKTGTYNISWVGWRTTTSGTNGTQLYKNGSALGSAQTSFVGSYGQCPKLTNQSLQAGDVLVVRVRSRSTSYQMYCGNLVIEQVS